LNGVRTAEAKGAWQSKFSPQAASGTQIFLNGGYRSCARNPDRLCGRAWRGDAAAGKISPICQFCG
jgi:hypothetical protein